MKGSLTLVAAVLLLAAVSAAWSADTIVSVYVGGKAVRMDPPARVREGVTYGPLRASAEAVGAHVTWDAKAHLATICTKDRCVPVRENQGIMVGSSMLIPVRLMGEALGRKVTWDARANAVRIQ